MESQADDTYSSSSKGSGPFVFVIDFRDPRAIEPAAPAGKGTHPFSFFIKTLQTYSAAWRCRIESERRSAERRWTEEG